MKILQFILDFIAILVKLITWVVVNGVPFLREIWEEIKDWWSHRNEPTLRTTPGVKLGRFPGLRWVFKSVTK